MCIDFKFETPSSSRVLLQSSSYLLPSTLLFNATNLCIKRTSLSSEKYLTIVHYIRSKGRTKIGHTEATSAKRPLPSSQYKASTSLRLLSHPLLDTETTICYISSKYPCIEHILEERSSDWVFFNACFLADSLSRTCADLPLTRFQ